MCFVMSILGATQLRKVKLVPMKTWLTDVTEMPRVLKRFTLHEATAFLLFGHRNPTGGVSIKIREISTDQRIIET